MKRKPKKMAFEREDENIVKSINLTTRLKVWRGLACITRHMFEDCESKIRLCLIIINYKAVG